MEIVGKIELVLLIIFNSGLPTKSQWITERPLQDIGYKFESISRYVETSPGGDRKAWFTIMMQAPNNAEPRPSDPRLTWMRVSNVNSAVSFFQANLNNTFIKATKSYSIPKIWLSSGTDEFSFQMNEVSTQETQTQFKGNSCQFGVEKKRSVDGKTHFKIILGNCDSIPYFYAQLKNENDKLLFRELSTYFSQTEEMASQADNTKYRTCTVDTLAIVEAGLSFKLDFTFSIFNENFGDDVLEGFMYMYNVLTI